MRQGVSEAENIRAIIMYDGSGEIESLCRWLKDDPDIEIVGEFDAVVDVITEIPLRNPELLFIDMGSTGEEAFDTFCGLKEDQMPVTIFAGDDERLALTAFKIHALDFLLKPLEAARVQMALRRAKQYIGEKRLANINGRLLAQMAGQPTSGTHLDRLMVKSGNRITFLKASEIDWIEAQGDYVSVHTAGKKHLLREKIGDLELQLPPGFFMRIHRSVIVNIDRIKEMQPLLYGECTVILDDGTRLTLSRSYRDKVFTRFSKAS